MTTQLSKAMLVFGTTAAFAAGGTTVAFAQSPPTAPPVGQETAGEAPESTAPENSATDPDNLQFEQQGDNQGDNGKPDAAGASVSNTRRLHATARHHKVARTKKSVTRHHRAQ